MLIPSQVPRESAWLTPRTLFHALGARAGLLLLVTLIVFACIAALIYTLPKGYQSEMELLVAPMEQAPLANAPRAAASETLINSEVELLRSAHLLNSVVLKNGLQRLELAEDNHRGETTPVTIDRALQRLQKNLKITPVKNSDVVKVTYSGVSPEVARDVLTSLADLYRQRRAELHTANAGYDFLHRQSAGWKDLLAKAEVDLEHYRRTYSAFVLPEEREAFTKRALEARAAAEQADAQVSRYLEKVKTEKQFLQQAPDIQKQFLQDEIELASLRGLRDRLKLVADRYRGEIRQLAVASVEHDSLARKVKVGESLYRMYKEKEEDARVNEVLIQDMYENVRVADGPTLPAEPSTPHLLNDLLIALACSLACGIAIVLMIEFFTPGHIRGYETLRAAAIGLE